MLGAGCNSGCSNEIIAVKIQILLKSKQNENNIHLAVAIYSYVYACIMLNLQLMDYFSYIIIIAMYKCEYNIINVAIHVLSGIAIYPYLVAVCACIHMVLLL